RHDVSIAQISVGVRVLDADGTAVCEIDPTPFNSASTSTSSRLNIAGCAAQYPPRPDQEWQITVTEDGAQAGAGDLVAARLEGPDGAAADLAGVPVALTEGASVVLVFDGDGGEVQSP